MWDVKILSWLVAVLLVSSAFSAVQDYAGKQDENYEDKPYKFGFSIENYLHREEEKDAAGLVHGEFGFVTGDGVYHVTAYATDETGDFKILKMKSYYVGLPGVDGPAVKKDDSGKPLPPMKMNQKESIPTTGIMGCGSCIIPTAEPPSNFIQPSQVANQDQSQYSQYPQDPNQYPQDPNEYPQDPNQYPQEPNQYPQDPNQYYNNQNQDPNQSVYPTFQPVLQDNGQSFPNIGKEISNSISSDDMLRLLYRFNYTIGFHGHHEVGDLAGNKQGGYFINGRDGYGRKFSYIANEFGYQPRVTLEDLSGEAVPKEGTEKAAKYGLKGYEFRWFY